MKKDAQFIREEAAINAAFGRGEITEKYADEELAEARKRLDQRQSETQSNAA